MTVYKGFGTKFEWHNGTALAQVVQCVNINGPNPSIASQRTTHMETAGGEDTFQPITTDNGEISLEIEYDPDDTVHIALIADARARTIRAWKITLTDPTPRTKAGSGFVSSFNESRGRDDILMLSVTIKVTGPVTEAAS